MKVRNRLLLFLLLLLVAWIPTSPVVHTATIRLTSYIDGSYTYPDSIWAYDDTTDTISVLGAEWISVTLSKINSHTDVNYVYFEVSKDGTVWTNADAEGDSIPVTSANPQLVFPFASVNRYYRCRVIDPDTTTWDSTLTRFSVGGRLPR